MPARSALRSIVRQEVAAAPQVEGSVEAPVLFFEDAPISGSARGIGGIMLSTTVQDVGPDGMLRSRRVAVAHLRADRSAYAALRNALERMELMMAPTAGAGN